MFAHPARSQSMKRVSLVGVGAGCLAGACFFVACLPLCVRFEAAWRGELCLVAAGFERCSTRMLSEPMLPAARLTREVPCATSEQPVASAPEKTEKAHA